MRLAPSTANAMYSAPVLVEFVAVALLQQLAERRNFSAVAPADHEMRTYAKLLEFGIRSVADQRPWLVERRLGRPRRVEFVDDALSHVLDIGSRWPGCPSAPGATMRSPGSCPP